MTTLNHHHSIKKVWSSYSDLVYENVLLRMKVTIKGITLSWHVQPIVDEKQIGMQWPFGSGTWLKMMFAGYVVWPSTAHAQTARRLETIVR